MSWIDFLQTEKEQPYYQSIRGFLDGRKARGETVYPEEQNIFRAFAVTPPEKVKVVILGQDPYHGEGQAMGLAFSVPKLTKVPPSLKNILKEAHSDVGIQIPFNGDLLPWANVGVFLLNTVLTVDSGDPGSHFGIGWETLTSRAIALLDKPEVVFMLWGKKAQESGKILKHARVLSAAHPSPFSAAKFFGCKHFSKANKLLTQAGVEPVDWRLVK